MNSTLALLVGVVAGVVFGLAGGFVAASRAMKDRLAGDQQLREQNERSLREQLERASREAVEWRNLADARAAVESHLATQTTLAEERIKTVHLRDEELRRLREQLFTAAATEQQLTGQLSGLRVELQKERENAHEKLKLLTDARAELTHQFEALAGKIFEDKSTRFTEQNKLNLDQILTPFRTQMNEFRGKVEEAQKDSIAGRAELRGKLDLLEKLNSQLASEAHNLSSALRGSSKAQGDWGEFILLDLLEKAGLRKGDQYRFQESFSASTDEDGARGKARRTDVILNLPGGRHLVIDSKVSLNAYVDHCNAATEDLRRASLKLHLASIRAHLDGLSLRSYHKMPGLDSPDFVVMFIPVEPAFLAAMQECGDLWREAYDKHILLVGPTTLLFVIRIVDNLWQQELQARSVADIVDRGTKLYDKFVGFVGDLLKVGDGLRVADQSYQGAMSKLRHGPGNLIVQVERLKKSGIRTKKQLPPKLLQDAGIDMEEQVELTLAASADDEAVIN